MDSKLRYWSGKEGGIAVNVLAYGFGFVFCLSLFNGGLCFTFRDSQFVVFFFFSNHQSLLTLCAEMTTIEVFFLSSTLLPFSRT